MKAGAIPHLARVDNVFEKFWSILLQVKMAEFVLILLRTHI